MEESVRNKLQAITITDFAALNHIKNSKGTSNHRENRPLFAIALKYEGETEYITDKGRFHSSKTSPVLLPKGISYEWRCIEGGRCYIVEFDADAELDVPVAFPLSDADAEKLLKLIQRLCFDRRTEAPLRRIDGIKNIYDMLLILLGSSKSYIPSDKYSLIKPAVEYIHLHYTESIGISDLEGLISISIVYFRKLFKSFFGLSPIEYIQKLRIDEAKRMLRSDYGTISDIALSLGYPNMYYFSRVFKSIEGISPSKYKNML